MNWNLEADLAQVLGYLNFSAGKPDSKTLGALNRIYARALPGSPLRGQAGLVADSKSGLQDALAATDRLPTLPSGLRSKLTAVHRSRLVVFAS